MRYVLSRVLVALGTLAFVLTFNFFLFRAAGDPEKDLLRNPKLTREAVAEIIQDRGLDKDLFTQYRLYVQNTLTGELETSYITGRPVRDELVEALPDTLMLVGTAVIIAAFAGIFLGAVAGSKRGSKTDTGLTQGSLTLYSMPEFWLGMIMIWIFAVTFQIFPTGLKETPGADYTGVEYWLDVAKHAVLPVTTLALGLAGQYIVIMRSSLTDVLSQDFITTARAIGLSRRVVMRRHAVRNALLPVVTLVALNIGFVVSGAITIEALFSWPGLGFLTLNAINDKDYPMLQGVFLMASLAVIVANLATDMIYGRLDPRVRTG